MRVLYCDRDGLIGAADEPALDLTTERHAIVLRPPPLAAAKPLAALRADPTLGVVISMDSGCPDRRQLSLLRKSLGLGRRAWVFWPEEGAIECVTSESLGSYRRLWLLQLFFVACAEPLSRFASIPRRLAAALYGTPSRQMPAQLARLLKRRFRQRLGLSNGSGLPGVEAATLSTRRRLRRLRQLRHAATPVPFPAFSHLPDRAHRIAGCGVYLRTDFWNSNECDGDAIRSCQVARELAAVTESFVCYVAGRLPPLDAIGLAQIVMPRPGDSNTEDAVVNATAHYADVLRAAFLDRKPAYVYERLSRGNAAAALLSAELGIPYIVEYPGSEIVMRRACEGVGYLFEAEYLETEALVFEQATMISVSSIAVRGMLLDRGVDPAKILVNPSGVDVDDCPPASSDERETSRANLGLSAADRLVGFQGAFTACEDIAMIAEAIPRICSQQPHARFLFIGDGPLKELLARVVSAESLAARVTFAGRVSESERVRLLKACDVAVVPRSRQWLQTGHDDSRATLLELMAIGSRIVASNHAPIAQVLSPALDPDQALGGPPIVRQRAVLFAPGDVAEFVKAVIAAVTHVDMSAALGRNARRAAQEYGSWSQHVANLWLFAAGTMAGAIAMQGVSADRRDDIGGRARDEAAPLQQLAPVDTGDAYKEQVQRQWDHDPAGSHYVDGMPADAKEWFLAIERHRYDVYAPWMRDTMEFDRHRGKDVLEIGGGIGTDLAQFALHGAHVTDADLSAGHLRLAAGNFRARGLSADFVHQDAESLAFRDGSFDVVYSNGALHHTPNTRRAVVEILRVLRPGGRVIVMMYAEDSWHYWRSLVWNIGLKEGQLRKYSMGAIMSRIVERSEYAAARPLVKVYTKARLRAMFDRFEGIEILQRQLEHVPPVVARLPPERLAPLLGWNLVLKANKAKA